MKELILALSYMLALIAVPVLIANILTIIHKVRRREYDEIFEFAIALVFGWIPPLVLRILFIAGDYGFMNAEEVANNGIVVPIMIAMTSISGVLHVRVLTKVTYPQLWIYTAVSAMILFISSLFFIEAM